jgi:glutathione S-transferase
MNDPRRVTLYYAPQSRSTAALTLLEELGAPYDLKVLNLRAGEQRQPAYLAINPMGKVPALMHQGQVITEQVAIYVYLSDLFPESKLAVPVGDPLRGSFLRWMAFYAACLEPACTDKSMKREMPPRSQSGYGDYDTVMDVLNAQLEKGAYILGDRMTVADILWGSALSWLTRWDLVPKTPAIMGYAERITTRPIVARVRAQDAALAAEHEKAAAGKSAAQ